MAGVFRNRPHPDKAHYLPHEGASAVVEVKAEQPMPIRHTTGADAFLWGLVLMGLAIFAVLLANEIAESS